MFFRKGFLLKRAFPFILLFFFILIQYLLYESNFWGWIQKNTLLFLLLQIDLLILLFLLYLLFRYLFGIFWEIRAKRVSKSLKYKLMAVYFLSITFPALILILGSFFFLKKGLDYWFEEYSSIQLATHLLREEDHFKKEEADLLMKAYKIRDEYISQVETIRSKDLRERYRYFLNLDSIEIYTLQGELFKKTYSSEITFKPGIPPSLIEDLLKTKKPQVQLQQVNSSLLLRVFILVNDLRGNFYILSVGKVVDPQFLRAPHEERQSLHKQITYFVILSFLIVLFLVLFLGVWVGNKLGKRLTEPIQGLILATQKISQRDYSLEDITWQGSQEDELATLIKSFKQMAQEIKRYEETLRKYNEYLGGVLNALPVGILILKENTEPFFLNQTLKNWLSSMGYENPALFVERLALKDYLQSLDLSQGFYKVFTLKEKDRDLSFGITFMNLELPEERLFLMILENLEEKKTLERLSLWREVAVKIAHEIKNPLTPIKLSIERLKRRLYEELPPDKKDLLEKTVTVVNTYIEELRKLAQDFYYLSQRPLFERREFDLLKNLEEVLELYKLAYPEVAIEVYTEAKEEESFMIKGDFFQMKRVWINLLDNSLKAMDYKGKIEIWFSSTPKEVKVVYQDHGPGLDEEVSKAFNKGNLEELQKLGTGLLIIKGMVELNGGKIEIEKNFKEGARFCLTFPKPQA